jgi:multimeric flavodoxin WrbA
MPEFLSIDNAARYGKIEKYWEATMNVVAFSGSARLGGNTALLVNEVFKELDASGIETELVQLAGKAIHGCRACYGCFKTKDGRCSFDDDFANTCIARMADADGIILASPTYFADVTSEMKALIDRAGFVARANDNMLKRKAGAAVVAVRRAGAIHAFDTINHFFLISEMIIPGSSYWNIGLGREKGQAANDEEGLRTMAILGENMAWLLKHVA